MNSIKIALYVVFAALLIYFSCDEDDPTNPSPKKADIFIYGLLGVAPHWSNRDSSQYWIYARVFNHPDHQNVKAELSHETTLVPLESDQIDEIDMVFCKIC